MSHYERTLSVPKLPVLGIDSFAPADAIDVHCILDKRDALFTTSGRAAILHALRAFDIKEGDQVLVPTYHCPTMIAPVVRVGAQPVFYPIDSSGSTDLQFVRSALRGRVKAILAVHFFGLPQPMRELRKLCDEHSVRLIEDCAHAFFGPQHGDPVGTVGDVAIASLPKFFPVVEGGCLTGAPETLSRVKLLSPSLLTTIRNAVDVVELGARHRGFGPVNWLPAGVFKLKGLARGRRGSNSDTLDEPTVPADQVPWLEDGRCAVRASGPTRWLTERAGRGRLVMRRRQNYALLSQLLADSRCARPLFPALPEGAVPYVFPLEVDEPDAAYRVIRRRGVPVFRWDQLWPDTPNQRSDAGARWARSVFQLGCHQDMPEADIRLMADIVLRAVDSGR